MFDENMSGGQWACGNVVCRHVCVCVPACLRAKGKFHLATGNRSGVLSSFTLFPSVVHRRPSLSVVVVVDGNFSSSVFSLVYRCP